MDERTGAGHIFARYSRRRSCLWFLGHEARQFVGNSAGTLGALAILRLQNKDRPRSSTTKAATSKTSSTRKLRLDGEKRGRVDVVGESLGSLSYVDGSMGLILGPVAVRLVHAGFPLEGQS